MQKQDLEDLELSQSLVTQLKTLIDGNQISADELKEKAHKIYECELKLALVWSFDASYFDSTTSGKRPASVHFGTSKAEFERHSQKLVRLAQTDKSVRAGFLGSFVDEGRDALLKVVGEVTVESFDKFSYSYECGSCGGRGYTSCYRCSRGKVSCSQCSGNGYTQRYQDHAGSRRLVQDTCYHCGGSGKTTCYVCGGSGRERCTSCDETGYFTDTRSLFATAKPSFSVEAQSEAYGEILGRFLSVGVSIQFIALRVLFEFLSHESEGASREKFFYKAQSFITELNFELLGKEHLCVGFSNPPFAFVRPHIFDDIFADELALIDKITKDGKITQKEAYGFFSKYQGQPVLDKAMINIAKSRENADDDLSGVVTDACQSFVSKEVAQRLAAFLSKCIDKISPAYSKMTWILGTLLFCVFALFGTELYFEAEFKDSIFFTILAGLLSVGIAWLLWGGILWCISSLITLFRRRKVPKEYRQRMRNHEARGLGSLCVLVVFLVGAVYGGLASKGIGFKLENHFNAYKTRLCEGLKSYEWDKKYQISSFLCPTPKAKKKATKSAKSTPAKNAQPSKSTNFTGSADKKPANASGAKNSGTKPANNAGAKTSFSGTKSANTSGGAKSSFSGTAKPNQSSKPANAKSVGSSKSTNPNVAGSTNKAKVADSPRQKIQ